MDASAMAHGRLRSGLRGDPPLIYATLVIIAATDMAAGLVERAKYAQLARTRCQGIPGCPFECRDCVAPPGWAICDSY